MHRTNIELDEKLVKQAMRLFGKKTKKELVHFALNELIRRERAKGILSLEGMITGRFTPAPSEMVLILYTNLT